MTIRGFARNARSWAYAFNAMAKVPREGRPHGLPGQLLVSLTSYPPRFDTLALTLACLLDQTIQPDRIALWIARQDIERVPNEVRWNMRQAGVEICVCDDIRSYKKLIPALEAFPDAFIVTADDDIHYPRDWLETLVSSGGDCITCIRAHRPKYRGGCLAPYVEWEMNVPPTEPTSDILPLSGAGVLFPPHSLHSDVIDRSQFMSLCPTSDDLWYWQMAKNAGSKFRKVGRARKLITWPGTDMAALWNGNQAANDAALARLSSNGPRMFAS